MTAVEIGAENDARVDDEEISLEERIIDAIESCASQDRTIRPGRLAQELGISIEEASAELSYLLAAVGGGYDGATFHFEEVSMGDNKAKTMVFQFPADFKRRLVNKQRKEDFQRVIWETMGVVVKILKIITAFGLILSLLILSVAAVVGLIGAIIAMSRVEGGHRQRSLLMHQLRSIFYSLRQILWLYALFGPPTEESSGEGNDPFFREVAYDLFLFFSMCCGNPGSIFFWLRASQWQSRRRQGRGMFRSQRTFASDIPGVTLLAADDRGADSARLENSLSSPQRGLLSIVVEFLFGPVPFSPGPTPRQVGLFRAAVLTKLSHESTFITLEQMAPYTDRPPKDLEDTQAIVQQGLMIVGYFHGIPSQLVSDTTSKAKAAFCFPELCSESAISMSPSTTYAHQRPCDVSFQGILYDTSGSSSGSQYSSVRQTDELPSFLWESPYRLTRLSPKQFLHCVGLGTLNLVGVVWLWQSLQSIVTLPPALAYAVGNVILPLLVFYAILFFSLPIGRLVVVVLWNHIRMQRNRKREKLSSQLQAGPSL